MITIRDEHHRIVDVNLPGSTLRVARVPGVDDESDRLVLSHGFGQGAEFQRPEWCGSPIQVSVHAIPALVAALAALEAS